MSRFFQNYLQTYATDETFALFHGGYLPGPHYDLRDTSLQDLLDQHVDADTLASKQAARDALQHTLNQEDDALDAAVERREANPSEVTKQREDIARNNALYTARTLGQCDRDLLRLVTIHESKGFVNGLRDQLARLGVAIDPRWTLHDAFYAAQGAINADFVAQLPSELREAPPSRMILRGGVSRSTQSPRTHAAKVSKKSVGTRRALAGKRSHASAVLHTQGLKRSRSRSRA